MDTPRIPLSMRLWAYVYVCLIEGHDEKTQLEPGLKHAIAEALTDFRQNTDHFDVPYATLWAVNEAHPNLNCCSDDLYQEMLRAMKHGRQPANLPDTATLQREHDAAMVAA